MRKLICQQSLIQNASQRWNLKNTTIVQYTESLLASPRIKISEDFMPLLKSGPARKLTLGQEFLHVLIRLRPGLLVEDLAFRFCVSAGKVSQITHVILLSKKSKSHLKMSKCHLSMAVGPLIFTL